MPKPPVIDAETSSPWYSNILYLVIIVIWLIVLGVIAHRYYQVRSFATESSVSKSSVVEQNEASDTPGWLLLPTIGLNAEHPTSLNNFRNLHPTLLNLHQEVLYTPLGEIHAMYDLDQRGYVLFYNKIPVSPIDNPNVIYRFQLSNHHILLIFAATLINEDPVYSMLDLSPDSKRLLHEVGNYEELISAEISPNQSCVLLKFVDSRHYTESGDYQLYQYCGNGSINKILDMKSEDYYKKKFARQTAKQILQRMEQDNCYNQREHSIVMTHACNYGIKYCYMFHAIVNPTPDRSYKELDQACRNRSSFMLQSDLLTN